MQVTYVFDFGEGEPATVTVNLDRHSDSSLADLAPAALPEWTKLERSKCPNCPLTAEQHTHCPAAADLAPTVDTFAQIISHQQAQVIVRTAERTVGQNCQVQDALSSLVGLIMATSGCPILSRMRGLARTHLPFASIEETMLRSVGAYLIRQWLAVGQGGYADWSLAGLKAHYADLEVLNKAFRQRLRSSERQDSALNAISALGALSTGIGVSIEDDLANLAELVFHPDPQ